MTPPHPQPCILLDMLKSIEKDMDVFLSDKFDPEYIIRERLHIVLSEASGSICPVGSERERVLDAFASKIMERTGINLPVLFNPDADCIPSLGVDELSEIIRELRLAEKGEREQG